MDISGKVVLITGASAGIGKATARAFAQAGAKVALIARSTDALAALEKELTGQGHEAVSLPADVRDRDAVIRAVEGAVRRFGRLDVLVNNAGQAAAGTVADVKMEHFRQITDLNIFGVVHAIQAAVPKMRMGGGGLIINISSMVSKMKLPGLGAYAATKAALNMLSDTARVELAPDNIRVITVFPRMTATDFGKNSIGDQRMRQQQRAGAAPGGVAVDSAEHVAEKIIAAARMEPPEQYMDG
jgi:short-subunit dehydrogenase